MPLHLSPPCSQRPVLQTHVPQRRDTVQQTNQWARQPATKPVCQAGRKATKAPNSSILYQHHKIVKLFPGSVLFSRISFPRLCLPYIFALYIHLFLICLFTSVFFNHLPCHFFFSLCPSAKWVGLRGYNHTRLIAAAKTSMAVRAPATV